jgi:hypothetical protein
MLGLAKPSQASRRKTARSEAVERLARLERYRHQETQAAPCPPPEAWAIMEPNIILGLTSSILILVLAGVFVR